MTKLCALCHHFTLRDATGQPLPQAAHGIGRCKGYDGHVAPVQPFVRWNARPCVLFGKARDIGVRQEWINEQIAKEDK